MFRSVSSRRTLCKAALGVAALVALGVAQADVLADVQKRGVIRVAIPQDFPPFGSLGSDLKLQGYDIDMANLVGKELGVKVELVPVTSTNRIPFLTTDKADIVISSLGKNAERAKVIDFTIAYANRAYLDPGDSRLRDAARRVSDLMLRSGQLGQPASLDGLTTPRFLPAGVRP